MSNLQAGSDDATGITCLDREAVISHGQSNPIGLWVSDRQNLLSLRIQGSRTVVSEVIMGNFMTFCGRMMRLVICQAKWYVSLDGIYVSNLN